MSPDGFLKIVDEFSAEFQHLGLVAEELRQLLFPTRLGELFTGTDLDKKSTDRLYDEVIDAFNRAIALQARRMSF
jgi:hypothetical protein